MRDFDKWLGTFISSIADWKYYTDFEKVYKNTEDIKIELNILNSLIGSKDIENEFRKIVTEYPKVLKVIPILLAKRESEIEITEDLKLRIFNFKEKNPSIDNYIEFMEKTGLFDLMSKHLIANLNDYVKGVEVGLDSNARKNRTEKLMENIVEAYLVSLGFIRDKNFFRELTAKDIYNQFGIDVRKVDAEKSANKRFDFVVKIENRIYAIEVNFYGSGGSKLNETARSYKMIAHESENIKNFTFIWITDGNGWYSAKNNLKETFNAMTHLYNINDLDHLELKKVLK